MYIQQWISVFSQTIDYGFTHVTSCSNYPQGDGATERGVRTMKILLNKSGDPYSALLAH